MKNILFLTHHYLSGNGGGVFASRAYINAFAKIAKNITLLYPEKDGFHIEGIDQRVNAIPVRYDVPKFVKLWHVLIGKSHRYFGIFEEVLAGGQYDTVVFDTSNVTWKLIDIAHKYKAKVITIHHNFQIEYDRDNTNSILKPIVLHWTKRRECECVLKSDLNLTITKQDKELLRSFYDKEKNSRIEILGCFEYKESTPSFFHNNTSEEKMFRFVITGNLSAIQTEKSLLPWLENYYPILKQLIPSASLTVAGKRPSACLIRSCKTLGITIIPSPESMTPIMENADFYICPTCLGGGLKLRVMDGLKWGLPVICHSVSARGYDVFKEKGILFTYEDKETFRECVKKIMNLHTQKRESKEIYVQEFSFASGVERIRKFIHA